MQVQSIQNLNFTKAENKNSKGRKIYLESAGVVLAAGVCCLASDRLFKNPSKMKNLNKFGFWASWAGIGMLVGAVAKNIYDGVQSKYDD